MRVLKNNHLRVLIIAIAPTFLLTACGGSSSDGEPSVTDSTTSLIEAFSNLDGFDDDDECEVVDAGCYIDRTGFQPSHEVTQFDGTWTGLCSSLGSGQYGILSQTISGQSGTRTQFFYTDNDCATPDSPATRTSDITLFYAAIFEDAIVGVNNTVPTNVTASNILFDGAPPTAEQQAQLDEDRAERTFFTSFRLSDDTTEFFEAVPSSFSDGRNTDDRTFDFDLPRNGLVRQ